MTIPNNITTLNQNLQSINKIYNQTVTVIAVSKNRTKQQIIQAINSGITNFAENYVQEALDKWTDLKQQYPHITLHFIGKLQSNKIKLALPLFNVFHTLESVEQINKFSQHNLQNKTFFIQINLDNNKPAGCQAENLTSILKQAQTSNLNVVGLMGILPVFYKQDGNENSNHNSVYFAFLKQLASTHNLPHLSMGMSQDYKEAVEFGATHIRIGTTIFSNNT